MITKELLEEWQNQRKKQYELTKEICQYRNAEQEKYRELLKELRK